MSLTKLAGIFLTQWGQKFFADLTLQEYYIAKIFRLKFSFALVKIARFCFH